MKSLEARARSYANEREGEQELDTADSAWLAAYSGYLAGNADLEKELNKNTLALEPSFWGAAEYENLYGLYLTEAEAKESAWCNEEFFPLYQQSQVNPILTFAKNAINVMEDFQVREDHAEWCGIKRQYGGGCNCMDVNAYSLEACATRIKQFLEKHKEIVKSLTEEKPSQG